jgi:hypothetical protein
MTDKRCTFKRGQWNCGSYQFNLYKDDIDQGDLCDVHYWQTKAQPAQEPVAFKHMMLWVHYLKRQSDFGKHMNIPSGFSAGDCWELANELERFIKNQLKRPWVGLTDEDRKA